MKDSMMEMSRGMQTFTKFKINDSPLKSKRRGASLELQGSNKMENTRYSNLKKFNQDYEWVSIEL